MHGPASYAGGSYKAPEWPDLPRIVVLDTIALALGATRRALWRSYRTLALDSWTLSGLSFIVEEAPAAMYPAGDWSNPDEIARLDSLIVPGKIRLLKMPYLYGGTIEAIGDWRAGGGVTAYKMGFKFWAAVVFRRKYLIAHEFGHALGLNHRPQTEINKSVMNGKVGGYLSPDAHDLDSLRRYYHL